MADRIVTADRTLNWNKWRLIPNPRLWQCVALSLNIDPNKVRKDLNNWRWAYALLPKSGEEEGSRILRERGYNDLPEFQDRLDVACANLSSKGALRATDYAAHPQNCSVSLRGFAAWVQKIGWEAPAELLGMADQEAVHKRRKHNKRETETRHREWQERIDALARDHPGTRHASLCRMLSKETGVTMSTIRRNTKARHC